MTSTNPIAAALGIDAVSGYLEILGRLYEYKAAAHGYSEGLYLADAGHGVSNPCFTMGGEHTYRLGQYLSRKRDGVKRAEAEVILAEARASVGRLKTGAYAL